MSSWVSSLEGNAEVKGIVVCKVNVSTVPSEDIPAYIETAQDHLIEPRMKKQGWIYYFIPVRESKTSLTFIDLATMASVTV